MKPLSPRRSRDFRGARRRHVEDRLPHRAAHAGRRALRQATGARIARASLGIGHQRSRGVKDGLVVDMDAAESRHPPHRRRRRAHGRHADRPRHRHRFGRAAVASQHFAAKRASAAARSPTSTCIACSRPPPRTDLQRGRVVMHSLPTGFSLDGAPAFASRTA